MATIIQVDAGDLECAISVTCGKDMAKGLVAGVLRGRPDFQGMPKNSVELIVRLGNAFNGRILDIANGYRADCIEWGDWAIVLRCNGNGSNGVVRCWDVREVIDCYNCDESYSEAMSYSETSFAEFAAKN